MSDDERAEPVTGEIVTTRAADGAIVPGPARSAGAFIDLLEDGQLGADLHAELKELGAHMEAISNSTQAKCKGRVTLTLDLEKDGDAFRIQGNIKVKAPDLPRKRSIAWRDEHGDFTRFPPQQTQMFGARPIRNV